MHLRYNVAYHLVALVTASAANAEDLSFEPSKTSDTFSQLFYISPDASDADCEKSFDVQLFAESPSLTFMPDESACQSGKLFVGSSASGKMHITLVPGRDRSGLFTASVTDDETGGVYSIVPDANSDMIVEKSAPTVIHAELKGRVGAAATEESAPVEEDDSIADIKTLGFDEEDNSQSHLRARKLWSVSVDIEQTKATVNWGCNSNKKDYIKFGSGSYKKFLTGGGGTCSKTFINLKCESWYKVKVRKCWYCRAKEESFKTDACGCSPNDACPVGLNSSNGDTGSEYATLVGDTVSGYCIYGSPPQGYALGTEAEAFVWEGKYYHKAFWDVCMNPPRCPEFQVTATETIQTQTDGNGNCLVGEAPAGQKTFVWNDGFYYSPVASLTYKPLISYWWGKVNQRKVDGVWTTDADGKSGANIPMLEYCQRYWKDTVDVDQLDDQETISFSGAGNVGSYPSTRDVFECVQPDAPCPYKPYLESRFDGANCFVAKIPANGSQDLYIGDYIGWTEGQNYYVIPDKVCPLAYRYDENSNWNHGRYGSRNCFVSDWSDVLDTFIKDNKWAYAPCPSSGNG